MRVLRIGAAQMGPIHKADSRQVVVRRMLDRWGTEVRDPAVARNERDRTGERPGGDVTLHEIVDAVQALG